MFNQSWFKAYQLELELPSKLSQSKNQRGKNLLIFYKICYDKNHHKRKIRDVNVFGIMVERRKGNKKDNQNLLLIYLKPYFLVYNSSVPFILEYIMCIQCLHITHTYDVSGKPLSLFATLDYNIYQFPFHYSTKFQFTFYFFVIKVHHIPHVYIYHYMYIDESNMPRQNQYQLI